MLACELDVPIGLNVSLTLFTGLLAVGFTFISLGKHFLRDNYTQLRALRKSSLDRAANGTANRDEEDSLPLLQSELSNDRFSLEQPFGHSSAVDLQGRPTVGRTRSGLLDAERLYSAPLASQEATDMDRQDAASGLESVSWSGSRQGAHPNGTPSSQHWSLGPSGFDNLMSMARHGSATHENAFQATFKGLVAGFRLEAVLMGLLWSLSLTSMHYGGLFAMKIPEGYMVLSPIPVVTSAVIAWVVCIAGYIYMTNAEPFLSQQVLFSAVTAIGIATMHFTGSTLSFEFTVTH